MEILESIKEEGIGWLNLMFEIKACKTLDLVYILGSTDVASENLLLDLRNRNVKYKRVAKKFPTGEHQHYGHH